MITSVNANPLEINEGEPSTITVTAVDVAADTPTLEYRFDCNNDQVFEVVQIGDNSTVCTFPEGSIHQVNVEVEDKDFGTDTDTVTVTVGNVAPIITLVFASPVPADEGQEVFLTATFRDPGALDTHTASVDWGDGTDPEDVPVGETHFIADIDASQEVPPVSGVLARATGSFTINSGQTELEYLIELDTGDGELTGTITAAHFHRAPAGVDGDPVRTISEVELNDNGFTAGTWSAADGQPFTAAMVSELMAGNLYINIHTTDNSGGEIRGQILLVPGSLSVGTLSRSHIYVDDENSPYTVIVSVTDNSDGAVGTGSLPVTVNNLPPIFIGDGVTATPAVVDEGGTSTITVEATDVPADVPDLRYSFDCDNDGFPDVGPQESNSAVCTFPDGLDPAVPNTVTVEVDDGDLGGAPIPQRTVDVLVNNVDPVIIGVTANPSLLQAGFGTSVIIIDAFDVAPDLLDLDYFFDCDGDGAFEVVQRDDDSLGCVFTQDDVGINTVNVKVQDQDGGESTVASTTVIVGAAVNLVLSPDPLALGIDLDGEGLHLTGDMTLTVEPNETPVADIFVVINHSWRIRVASIDSIGGVNCSAVDPDGTGEGTITCVGSGDGATGDFVLATIQFTAFAVGRAAVVFDLDVTEITSALGGDDSVLGSTDDSRVKVEGIVDVVLEVDLQAVPLGSDNVRFDVGLGQDGAPVRFFPEITGDQAGQTFIVTLPGVRTDVYEIGITAVRDGGLRDTLVNLRIDVDIDRAPDDAADPLIVDMGVLLEGNAIDDDDIINALDLSLLASVIRDGRFEARVDFDRSGVVDAGDLDLLCGPSWDSSDGVPPCANYLESSPVVLNQPELP